MSVARPLAGRRRPTFALLAMAQFVVVLDITIVNVALPSVQTSLRFSGESLTWVVDAYMLTFGGFLLLGGRAADLFGQRRMFLVGLTVFGMASMACGLAATSGELVAARAVQGLGGALLSPASLSLVALTFQEDAERDRAMGIWNAVAGAGGATGVVLGGALTDSLGWPWVFWVNVPLTLGGALIGLVLITDVNHITDTPGRVVPRLREFDVLGSVAVTAGLSALILGLVRFGEHGPTSAVARVALVAAVVLLGVFVVVELRVPTPLVHFGMFRSRSLSTANGMILVFMAGVVATNFFVTLYAQRVLGYGSFEAGLSLLPLALGQILFSQLASRCLPRLGTLGVLLIGMGAAVLGFGWFSLASADGSFVTDVLGPAVLVSVGGGFGFVALIVLAVSGVDPRRAGLAGGLVNMSQQVGGALGLAVLASLAVWRTDRRIQDGAAVRTALTDGFRLGWLTTSGVVLAATLAATLALRGRGRETPTRDTRDNDSGSGADSGSGSGADSGAGSSAETVQKA
ncbi:MFS transporter [Streptomyces graminilatus]|uniref:MFS transporter n=1 Tax=Streptomyces graminilatus TaxID=1464070 RepID=UPI0006E3CE10|nr:MFS transporter [Streptomyces graminilatus]